MCAHGQSENGHRELVRAIEQIADRGGVAANVRRYTFPEGVQVIAYRDQSVALPEPPQPWGPGGPPQVGCLCDPQSANAGPYGRITIEYIIMAVRKDIDDVLHDWPYEPGVLSARMVTAADGRQVLQMRVEMGLLQMEIEGRPDGQRPHDEETYLDYLIGQALLRGRTFSINRNDRKELDREFVQYYHRRVCWLALREFRRAIDDANHTLALMDFADQHCRDSDWVLSHDQYRPFVLMHRTQAAALAEVEEGQPESAIEIIGEGLEEIGRAFHHLDESVPLQEDQILGELGKLQETIRREYRVGRTLREQLADAVAAEQYELAARLRDEIRRRAAST